MSHSITIEELANHVTSTVLASCSKTRKQLVMDTTIVNYGNQMGVRTYNRFIVKDNGTVVFADNSVKSAVAKYNSLP